MYKDDVIDHFRGMANFIRALEAGGFTVTRQGVYNWPDVIPLRRAFQVEKITKGELKPDLDVYRMYYRVKDKVA